MGGTRRAFRRPAPVTHPSPRRGEGIMTQTKKAGDKGAGLLPWVQGLAPAHVAIIMDGNGRWAISRGLARSAGHRAGVDAVRRIVEAATGLGITTPTLFAFSSDNWTRPEAEVNS